MKHFAQKSFSLLLCEAGHVFTSLSAQFTNALSKLLTKLTIELHEAGMYRDKAGTGEHLSSYIFQTHLG